MNATLHPAFLRLARRAFPVRLLLMVVLLPAIAAISPLVCGSGTRTVNLYLNLNGQYVKGESSEKSLGRQDSIEVRYYEQSIAPGQGANKTWSFMIRKRIDRASPLLIQGMLSRAVAKGNLRFYRPNPTGDGTIETFYWVVFEDGLITAVKQVVPETTDPANTSDPPLEEVTIEAGRMQWIITDGGITADTNPAPPGSASPGGAASPGTGSSENTPPAGTGSSGGSTPGGAAASDATGPAGTSASSSTTPAATIAPASTAPVSTASADRTIGAAGRPARATGAATATQPADGATVSFGQWYYSGGPRIALMVRSATAAKAWSSGAALEEKTSLMRVPISFRNDGGEAWHAINATAVKVTLLDAKGQTISGESHLFYPATRDTDGSYEILGGQRLDFVDEIAYRTGTQPAELVVRGFETTLRYRIGGG